MAFAFENLLVYQKSVNSADQVCDLTEPVPARCNYLADQLNRASLSISSNIAEGNGRFTKPDRKHFFGIARGSVQECVPQPWASARRLMNNPGLRFAACWRVSRGLRRDQRQSTSLEATECLACKPSSRGLAGCTG